MTSVAPYTAPGTGSLPEGWVAQWSPDHNAWYYLNTYTKLSVWEVPTVPATSSTYPAPASPPNQYNSPAPASFDASVSVQQNDAQGFSPTPPYTPPNQGAATGYFGQAQVDVSYQLPGSPPTDTDNQDQNVLAQFTPGAEASLDEVVEGERGFVKTAIGAGAGVLMGNFLSKQKIKRPSFNFSFPGSSQIQQHHHHHSGGAGIFGGLATAATAATAWSAANNNKNNYNPPPPPPPPNQPGPPPQAGPPPPSNWQQTSYNSFNSIPASIGYSGPRLTIWSANYGSGDCTEKARQLITPQQTLDLTDNGDTRVYDKLFGDNWVSNPKSLCILYQYEGRPLELLVTCQNGGNPIIRPDESMRPDRRAYITECGPVIAVIWGIMEGRNNPVSPSIIQDIANYKIFTANNDYFGFNGWSKCAKTCVIFLNRDGRIYNVTVREDGTGRI